MRTTLLVGEPVLPNRISTPHIFPLNPAVNCCPTYGWPLCPNGYKCPVVSLLTWSSEQFGPGEGDGDILGLTEGDLEGDLLKLLLGDSEGDKLGLLLRLSDGEIVGENEPVEGLKAAIIQEALEALPSVYVIVLEPATPAATISAKYCPKAPAPDPAIKSCLSAVPASGVRAAAVASSSPETNTTKSLAVAVVNARP